MVDQIIVIPQARIFSISNERIFANAIAGTKEGHRNVNETQREDLCMCGICWLSFLRKMGEGRSGCSENDTRTFKWCHLGQSLP